MDGAAGPDVDRPADLELARVCIAPEGCFGVLLASGLPTGLWSVERTYPLVENRPRGPQFVKIPGGRYRCIRTIYQAHAYETFEITGVAGHSRLLIHIANEETDVDGCIGIGRRYGLLRGSPAVLDSCGGFADFMRLIGDRASFELLVRGPS